MAEAKQLKFNPLNIRLLSEKKEFSANELVEIFRDNFDRM